jgi:ABC-2 type transport system ATP-binding protein
MDPESARLVRDAIHTLRSENRTIIICTHNLAEAEELSDQIAIIRRGRIIARGTPLFLKTTLLGPEAYEVRLAAPLEESTAGVPEGLPGDLYITDRGPDWFQYQTSVPLEDNPRLIQHLVEHQIRVVSLQAVNRSLEKVYLQAINAPEGEEIGYVG